MIASCSWDHPNTDRYAGDAEAAIHAFAQAPIGMPAVTRQRLLAKFNAREIDDTIVIDRDSIRGRNHEYAADIRFMHFGSRGQLCGTVTRSGWTDDHVETALVFCADGTCIAWPAVCGNWFVLDRRERALPGAPAWPYGQPEQPGDVPVPVLHDVPTEPGAPALPGEPLTALTPPLELLPPIGEEGPPQSFLMGFQPGGFIGTGFYAVPVYGGTGGTSVPLHVPTLPVPEIPTYAAMLAGLAALLLRKRLAPRKVPS